MYLIFDIEVSGFWQPNYDTNYNKQGRLMQLAAILLDENFIEKSIFSSLIKIPKSCIIHDKAFEVHHISMEDCQKYGMVVELALCNFEAMVRQSQYQVAHNIKFDSAFLSNEDAAAFGQARFTFTNPICTMEAMTPICKLPYPSGKGGYKWPTLEEAHNHLFPSIETPSFHNTLNDVRATAKIFKYLVLENFIKIENIS
jgi:DNA polymerase III epsilon subunit-like protein